MNTTANIIEENNFELKFETRYARVYANENKGMIICELLADYIPIEDFKDTFSHITSVVESGKFNKFIFDKRSLRAFHQPSMEWYFLNWKNKMLELGIDKHRKILPEEKWFEKMVMIAKEQILKNNPENIIHLLDIKYCDSVEEAILV
ncbi:MAG: hypothetical protein ACXIUQ_17140 [Cecembia sp.]